MPNKPMIAVDFDGVIHAYSEGYKDGSIYDKPVDNAKNGLEFIEKCGFKVIISTARDKIEPVREWLKENGFKAYEVTNKKPPAVLYIDDNAMRFESWEKVISYFIRNHSF